jgi:hypothetical protein
MSKQTTRDFILWVSALAGPILWLFSFQAKFSWNTWTCASQTKSGLFVFALIAFMLTAGAGVLAWREFRDLSRQLPRQGGEAFARSRFMAIGGIVFSIGFCLVILAQTIPDLILEACQ